MPFQSTWFVLSLYCFYPFSRYLSDSFVFFIVELNYMSNQMSDHLSCGGTGGGVDFYHVTADRNLLLCTSVSTQMSSHITRLRFNCVNVKYKLYPNAHTLKLQFRSLGFRILFSRCKDANSVYLILLSLLYTVKESSMLSIQVSRSVTATPSSSHYIMWQPFNTQE